MTKLSTLHKISQVLSKVSIVVVLCVIALTSLTVSADFSTTAQSCCVMERSSKRVLYAKNENKQLPMASTTKIMTAIVAIENNDLDRIIKVPKCAVGVEGSSLYLRENEQLTVRELLYGLMLRSGNDCAVAIAVVTSGSVEKFVELMNDKATQLSLNNTHFDNPHGLHSDTHYTSAYDLALITAYALDNDVFRRIVSTQNVSISNDGYNYQRQLKNKNKLLTDMDCADGVKTGYTKKAGRCFVGSATRNGMQVVCVVLNCGPMFEETKSMLETALSNYTLQCVIPKNKVYGSLFVNGKQSYYKCTDGFYYPLACNEVDKIDKSIKSEGTDTYVEIKLDGVTIHSQLLELC